MAALGEIYFKKETLQTLVDVLNKKGENGVSITVSINDDSNEWGQNISAFVSQSKEEREAKKKRFYVGNGKVFWNDSKIVNGVKPEDQPAVIPTDSETTGGDDGDLPF